MDERKLTIEDIEELKNMTVVDLTNRLHNDITVMELINENMSVYEYIKLITYK